MYNMYNMYNNSRYNNSPRRMKVTIYTLDREMSRRQRILTIH